MEKKDVIEFFDRCAPTWDAEMVKSDKIINAILDNAEIGPGMDVLDVACGKYVCQGRTSDSLRKISRNIFGNACKRSRYDIFPENKSRLPCAEFSHMDCG